MQINKGELVDFEDVQYPKVLYKYRDFKNSNHKRIVTHNEVFYASPMSFEDKLDCKNHQRYDLLTNEEILNYFFCDSMKNNPNLSLSQHMEFAVNLANSTSVKDKSLIKKWEIDSFEKFNERMGILSLTEYPLEINMWERYADNHNGFCVGFDSKIMFNAVKSGAMKVNYVKELPIIHPFPKHSLVEQIIFQIFHKLKEWEFEKEYRSYIFRIDPLTNQDRAKVIPAEAFKEIILGAKMSNMCELDLVHSLPKTLKQLPIKKAILEDGCIFIKDY